MKKRMPYLASAFLVLAIGSNVPQLYAQDAKNSSKTEIQTSLEESISPFYLHTQVKSMHLWRGLAVTNSWMVAMDGGVGTNDGKLKGGIWGGYSSNGVYREFDYYAIYTPIKNLSFAFWDIYNYSTNATWNNNSFLNYNADTTGHFLDLSANYTISEKVPLSLYWATIIEGRDRTVKKDANRYSTYVQASYPVVENKAVNLNLIVGYSFALKPDKDSKAQFYGPKDGFNNIGFALSRDLHIGQYVLPVSVTPSWNVIGKQGNVQLVLNLF